MWWNWDIFWIISNKDQSVFFCKGDGGQRRKKVTLRGEGQLGSSKKWVVLQFREMGREKRGRQAPKNSLHLLSISQFP